MSTQASVILRAFDVNKQGGLTEVNLVNKLSEVLSDSGDKHLVDQRMMKIKENDESSNRDVLIDYSFKNGTFFGAILRIASGVDVPEIENDELNNKVILPISKWSRNSENFTLCKDIYYVALNKTHAIVTLQSNLSIKRCETYIRWMLGKDMESLSFTPIIDLEPLYLDQVSKIRFQDDINGTTSKFDDEEVTLTHRLFNLASDAFKSLFYDKEQDLDSLIKDGLVQAELILKFKKRKEPDNEKLKSSLSAMLKPMSDIENCIIKTNNGRQIKSSDILKSKKVVIDKSGMGILNEEQLFNEMLSFMYDL